MYTKLVSMDFGSYDASTDLACVLCLGEDPRERLLDGQYECCCT